MATPIFVIGDFVLIDNRGNGVVTAVIDFGRNETEYFVQIEGTDYDVRVKASRLRRYPPRIWVPANTRRFHCNK